MNNPHLEPIKVISLIIVGVKSRFSRDAIVDFKITVPLGFTSFIVSENPELLPVASITKSNNCSSVDSIPTLIFIPDWTNPSSFFSCLPKHVILEQVNLITWIINWANLPSPTTATFHSGFKETCSLISKAAAKGSTNTACSSLMESGIICKFFSGNERNSANAPFRFKIPSTVRDGQCLSIPLTQESHLPQPALISPTTLLPIKSELLDFSITPTNSWPRIPLYCIYPSKISKSVPQIPAKLTLTNVSLNSGSG